MIDLNIPSNYGEGGWQNNRLKFILKIYPKEFFKNKTVLELGSQNGFIGNFFSSLGSVVTVVEGREPLCEKIKNNYPHLTVLNKDVDQEEWEFGQFDIIVNWGLLYHLHKFARHFLINTIINSKFLFLETVVFDFQTMTVLEIDNTQSNNKFGDQGLSNCEIIPSTQFVQSALNHYAKSWTRFDSTLLNSGSHNYTWETSPETYSGWNRRFWIAENV